MNEPQTEPQAGCVARQRRSPEQIEAYRAALIRQYEAEHRTTPGLTWDDIIWSQLVRIDKSWYGRKLELWGMPFGEIPEELL